MKKLFIFDEGRGFFGKELAAGTASGRTNIQTEIMTKSRSYGMGTCIGTQSATMLQSSVVDNVGTFIALRTNSENESKFCCRRLGLDDSRYRELMELEVGEAWIVSPRCTTPVKIRIPYTDLGNYPSFAEIEREMQPVWSRWDAQTTFAPSCADDSEVIDFKSLLGEEKSEEKTTCEPVVHESAEPAPEPPEVQSPPAPKPNQPAIISDYLTFLTSCQENPEFGATAHYKAIGWSAGKGNRIKKKLIEVEWITSARVTSAKGGRPRETLQLTEKGAQILNEC